ncbi:MAG: hypothetical protein D6759_02555 [Chloroflexi bacterium]|nr:MAG: hypothetical protein D6759_02555 [Chloroflexota bacterium]
MTAYVDWFVDREKQFQGFLKMVARETEKQVMLVQAPAEMGKTWLIQRLRHECRSRGIPVAHFDFRDRRPWDYLTIVRQARDQLGPAYFNPMTQVINASTGVNVQITTGAGAGGVDLSIADAGGQVVESEVAVGDVAGRDIIKDNFFFVQADSETARRAIEIRITDAFFACLEALCREQVVAFLFDSYEDVTEEADRWLRAYLLARVRDGLLPNLVIVLAGREVPPFDTSWRHCLARTGLHPFDKEDVVEYIVRKRGLTDLDLETIYRTSGGHPGLLGKMADIAALESEEDEDWL